MKFEIKNHGPEHVKFFPGVGVACTLWQHVVTGSGDSARQAGEDALELFWEMVEKRDVTVAEGEALEAEVQALSDSDDRDKVANDECEDCDIRHWVSIFWRYNS